MRNKISLSESPNGSDYLGLTCLVLKMVGKAAEEVDAADEAEFIS